MRVIHGKASAFSDGIVSDPPNRVLLDSAVRRESLYSRLQFTPHAAGSVVSSLTSTNRTYGLRASCLRSTIDVSRLALANIATPDTITTETSHPIRRRPRPVSGLVISRAHFQGLAPWPAPRWQWTHFTASSRV